MKLADYLLYQLHENFTTLPDDDGDVPSDYEDFDEYLDEKNFKDLKRYHLDDLDALNDRIDQIKEKLAKREKNEAEAQKKAQEQAEHKDDAAKAMLVLLGQAAKKSNQNITFDVNGFTNAKLITTAGRNALYLTLRDTESNNVIAEVSYKMSRNSFATRYYDFEENYFSDWAIFVIDPDWQEDCYDPAYELKQRLTAFMQDSDEPVLVNEFIAGYFGTDDMESKLDSKQASKDVKIDNGTNQDWVEPESADDDCDEDEDYDDENDDFCDEDPDDDEFQ